MRAETDPSYLYALPLAVRMGEDHGLPRPQCCVVGVSVSRELARARRGPREEGRQHRTRARTTPSPPPAAPPEEKERKEKESDCVGFHSDLVQLGPHPDSRWGCGYHQVEDMGLLVDVTQVMETAMDGKKNPLCG